MEFPETVISVAIEPKTAADEKKLLVTLEQLKNEDPSFTFRSNQETGQLLIFGMGELHLEIIADRLQREFNVGIRVGKPQVSYRESIAGTASESYTFHKELGGKTQFGQVTIKVEHADYQAGVMFESTVTPKQLGQNFIDAIKKSVIDTAPGGAMAGYPFLNIKATLTGAGVRLLMQSQLRQHSEMPVKKQVYVFLNQLWSLKLSLLKTIPETLSRISTRNAERFLQWESNKTKI
jgi:elongation factor G